MGFKHWAEGMTFIGAFLVIVGVPCVLIAILGSKKINDLGNFPTKTAKIQVSADWKIALIGFIGLGLLGCFFQIFS